MSASPTTHENSRRKLHGLDYINIKMEGDQAPETQSRSVVTQARVIARMGARLLSLENTISEHHRLLQHLQSELGSVKQIVEEAVQNVMPKVEALLAEKKEGAQQMQVTPRRPLFNDTKSILDAAEEGDADTLLRLLEAGADVHLRNQHGDTALHLAASQGHERCVIHLIGCASNVNAPGRRMRTPLHYAVMGGHINAARRLIKAASDVDRTDKDGYTALTYAAKEGKWDIVKLLLEEGASAVTSIRLGLSHSPVLLAVRNNQVEILRMLLKQKDKLTDEELSNALAEVREESVAWTFEEMIPGTLEGSVGRKALLGAAEEGRIQSMILLLDSGIDIDIKSYDCDGRTALHSASFQGRLECIKLLLKRGASVNVVDSDNCTPLFLAAKNGQEECVRVLLGAGADPQIKEYNGKTPYDVARTEVLRKLLSL